MKIFRTLVSIPIALTLASCSGEPPQVTADSREAAFQDCTDKIDAVKKRVLADRKLAKDNPEVVANYELREQIKYFSLVSREYEDVALVQFYCRPYKTSTPGYWTTHGWVEYLTNPGYGKSKLEHMHVAYGQTWFDEESIELYKQPGWEKTKIEP